MRETISAFRLELRTVQVASRSQQLSAAVKQCTFVSDIFNIPVSYGHSRAFLCHFLLLCGLETVLQRPLTSLQLYLVNGKYFYLIHQTKYSNKLCSIPWKALKFLRYLCMYNYFQLWKPFNFSVLYYLIFGDPRNI